jgi:hypothetical protein
MVSTGRFLLIEKIIEKCQFMYIVNFLSAHFEPGLWWKSCEEKIIVLSLMEALI